jgi:hypothetical protein
MTNTPSVADRLRTRIASLDAHMCATTDAFCEAVLKRQKASVEMYDCVLSDDQKERRRLADILQRLDLGHINDEQAIAELFPLSFHMAC